jgi:hypothetical protein
MDSIRHNTQDIWGSAAGATHEGMGVAGGSEGDGGTAVEMSGGDEDDGGGGDSGGDGGAWEVRWSDRYQSNYYVNRATRKSVWKRPEGFEDVDEEQEQRNNQCITGGEIFKDDVTHEQTDGANGDGANGDDDLLIGPESRRRSFGQLQLAKIVKDSGRGADGAGGNDGGGPHIWARHPQRPL